MVADFGLDVVEAYMGHVQDNAAESVARVIETLSDCEYEYPTDTGQVIRVKISVDRDSARGDRRFHRHLGCAWRTTSTRPNRWPAPPCSTASG
jgi:hypothetical protein